MRKHTEQSKIEFKYRTVYTCTFFDWLELSFYLTCKVKLNQVKLIKVVEIKKKIFFVFINSIFLTNIMNINKKNELIVNDFGLQK